MSTRTKSFPNPVLGNGNDYRIEIDNNVVQFSAVKKDNDNFYSTVTLKLDDEVINNLIKEEKAAFFCDIDCVKTNYRTSKWSFGNIIELTIPRVKVVDNVDVNCYIVAMKPIEGFTHDDFNEMYENASFSLEEGDFIATLGSFYFNASVKYNKCPAPSSLMQVERASDEANIKATRFYTDENRIYIVMPAELFDIYTKVCLQNNHAADMFISAIAVDALSFALMSVLDDSSKLAEYLRNLLEKNNIVLDDEHPEMCLEAARKLLEDDGVDPYTTFMKDLDAVFTYKNELENGNTD